MSKAPEHYYWILKTLFLDADLTILAFVGNVFVHFCDRSIPITEFSDNQCVTFVLDLFQLLFWSFLIFFGVSCFGLQYFQSRPIWLLPKNGCAQHSVSCIFVSLTYFYFDQISTSAVFPDPCDHTYLSVQRSTALPKRAGLRSKGVSLLLLSNVCSV